MLKSEEAARQTSVASLQDAVSRYSSRLGLRLDTLEGVDHQFSDATAGHVTYLQRIQCSSCSFAGAHGNLRFILTCVDRRSPAREFTCSIHINDDDLYDGELRTRGCGPATPLGSLDADTGHVCCAADCPDLPPDTVHRLVTELNESRDLSAFVRRLRQELVKTAND